MKMKPKLSKILAMCMAVCLMGVALLSGVAMPVSAEEFTEGYYTYEIIDGGAVITDVDTSISGDIVIPDTLGGYAVTEIGELAFYNCNSLTRIEIPDSVTSISDGAFGCCESLTSIDVDRNNQNYASIDGVLYNKAKTGLICCPEGKSGSIVISDSVTNISSYAFSNCTSLTSIVIPNSVTSISYGAFSSCDSLTSIDVDSNNQNFASIDGVLYNKAKTELICCPAGTTLTSIEIPNSVTSIGERAFYHCNRLTGVEIPDSVTSIGKYAFNSTAYYKDESNWEDGVLYIGNHLIEAKEDISGEYKIKEGTKTIAESAFSGCDSLTSITIPNSVTSIGRYAFEDCSSLTSIEIPESVTSIGNYAFGYVYDYYGHVPMDDFTIYGYTGTIAETYATENGFEFISLGEAPAPQITKGDLNGDGTINSTDFMQVRRHFLGIYTIPEDKQPAADVNGDGLINSTDFMQIRRHFLGLYVIN